jgi:cytochrome o ubiquinol oxidase subunit II
VAAPVDRPIRFRITASSVMNAFYVPELAGMVYAMPGMETQLHAVINHAGDYEGFSANYSGAGFSGMKFRFLGMSDADFAGWVQKNRDSGEALSREAYLKLEQPSHREPVRRYAKLDAGLYGAILNRCADGQKMCVSQMMAIDAAGGAGKGGISGVTELPVGDGRQRSVVAALCTPSNPTGAPIEAPATATR